MLIKVVYRQSFWFNVVVYNKEAFFRIHYIQLSLKEPSFILSWAEVGLLVLRFISLLLSYNLLSIIWVDILRTLWILKHLSSFLSLLPWIFVLYNHFQFEADQKGKQNFESVSDNLLHFSNYFESFGYNIFLLFSSWI